MGLPGNREFLPRYKPELGRWINRDPIGEEGGMNVYGFVGNDPVHSLDVLGLSEYVGHHGYVKVKRDIEPTRPEGIIPMWRDLGRP